ncbi:hypothetical protein [Kitasatospora sp. NPDC004272]
MTDNGVRWTRAALAQLIDPEARPADSGGHLDVSAEDRSDQVRSRLEARFRERPELSALTIRLDGQDIGIATRRRLRATAGTAGEQPEFGGADRAALPGPSQQFKAVRFACRSCGATAVRSYYEPRDLPECGVAGHGPLEFRR